MSWGQVSTETAWDNTKYANYSKWGSDNTYRITSGQFVIPLAITQGEATTENAAFVLVSAHPPISFRNVTFDTTKKGGPPVVPSPESSGPFVFLEGQLHFSGPSVSTNGYSFDWGVSGSYTYVQNARFDPGDGFVLTSFPFPLAQQVANQGQFSTQPPTAGPVPECGLDVQTGYAQGQQIQLNSPYWRYNTISFFPAQLLNADMVIGGVPAV
jgi:hypothetical protein